MSHIRRFNSMAVALTGEAATDGSVALGINLNFSLDPRHGLTLSRRPLAQAGRSMPSSIATSTTMACAIPASRSKKARWSPTGTLQADQPTDANGAVTVGGLTAYMPITVGIDETSLDDPMLVPKKALQVVVPRPGIPAEVEIGLVGGGDVEGALVKSGGLGFEGVDLELVDATGKVVGTARTDFDGFFLFERVPYGSYTRPGQPRLRPLRRRSRRSRASALGSRADKSVVRLGSIQASAADRVGRSVRPEASRCSRACRSRSCGCMRRNRRFSAGAVEKTRTSTAFRPQRPQRCASTSSATTARHEMSRPENGRHWQGAAPSKALSRRAMPRRAAPIRSISEQFLRLCLPFAARAR